ncbi:MAG: hypothetical protein HYU04_00345 [Candidatus Wildermuthbacteria bacterium]|nr:hypothetical protein [Candidatus Wildermuthbacteria bacterium]
MKETSTQQFLEFEEIKEGILVLRGRQVRGVLMVSSQNFALKSEEEQQAIIFQFQSFLNSLDFPLQISIQSRRLNITGYLDFLKELEINQQNELLKKQTEDYRLFVERLIAGGSIMAKNFFVTVPFSFFEVVDGGKPKFTGSLSEEEFQRMKNQLWQRMEYVALGLRRAGLQVVPLNTEELVELLWSWHHPQESEVGYYPEIPPEILK